MKKTSRSFDFIISTVPKGLDIELFLGLLRPKGILCIVGALDTPINVAVISLLRERKAIAGSNIGGCYTIQEMLDFAARKNIGAVVEVFPMSDANKAIEKVRKNQVRYRAVLVNQDKIENDN
jgi:uncharacterized zinc-type alcohol dehydrogenase-like protein